MPGARAEYQAISPSRDKLQRAACRAIEKVLPSPPTLQAIAHALSLNERTLQRRMADSGCCYRQLLDSTRLQLAEKLLSTTDLSIAEISSQLGYSGSAHFTRAFRRWTGVPPTRYRESGEGDSKAASPCMP